MTIRAVCLAGLAALVLLLIQNYNDYVLNSTLLFGNHLPVAGTLLLLVCAVAVNPAARRLGRAPLSPAELMLVWGLVTAAGGVGGSGLMRCLPGWVAAPGYLGTPSNDFAPHVLAPLPDGLLVGKDAEDPALRWYMEGLPRGRAIPWARWTGPLWRWGAFGALMIGAMFGLCAVFYRQWAGRERLVFPLTVLPLALAEAPAAGRRLNAFLANRVTWMGVAVPVALHGLNGLRSFWPALPAVPLEWSADGWFPDRPWSQFGLGTAHVYFSFVGVTFLLTTEMAFSLWFFYVLFRLSYVWIAWLGAGATGFWGQWYDKVAVFEGGGAIVALAAVLAWTARAALAGWVRRALRGEDAREEPLPPRLALGLVAGGSAGMAAWLVLAGAQPWAAVVAIGLWLCVLLVLTRIVAETGLLFVGNRSPGADFVFGLVPPGRVTAPTAALLMMLKGILMRDLKEVVMPYVMNGLRVWDTVRLRMRPALGLLAAVTAAAFLVSAFARISTGHKYGAVNGDDWANLLAPHAFLGQLVGYRKHPPTWDVLAIGGVPVLPATSAHVVIGMGLVAVLTWLRARFLAWPLSPYGLVMCATYQMDMAWFSLFLGWAARAAVMTFGGAALYRRVLPWFLGLVLGEAVIAAVWIAVALATGEQGRYLLPD